MSKKEHYKDTVSQEDKNRFSKYLSEDEELILVTGLSAAYLRRVFILFWAIPGIFLMLGGMFLVYLTHDKSPQALLYGLLVGFLSACILAGVKTFITNLAHRYLLTTRRVMVKKGFFAVDLRSALFDKITNIEVVQSFMDRVMFHHGKIIINTAGVNKQELTLDFVDHPLEFKNLLERLINREREHAGRSSGPVSTIEGEIVDE